MKVTKKRLKAIIIKLLKTKIDVNARNINKEILLIKVVASKQKTII